MMHLWHFIVDIWHDRQRQIDMKVLWPICKQKSTDLDHAKAAFAVHAFNDPAWLALKEDHIRAIIDALT